MDQNRTEKRLNLLEMGMTFGAGLLVGGTLVGLITLSILDII